MKIALLAPFAPDEHAGGTERVAWAHARALRERGHAVRLVVGTERGSDSRKPACELVEGIELFRIARLGEERHGLDLVRPRVLERVRAAVGDAEVAHVHHWHTLSEGLVAALAPERVVVLSLHDHFASCPRFFRAPPAGGPRCPSREDFATCARCVAIDLPRVAKSSLVDALRARAERSAAELALARAILVPSHAHLERLAATLPLAGRDVRVLEPGACMEFHGGRPPPPRFDGRGELCVLHFGRRSPEKGTLDLVHALASLGAGRARLIAPGGSESAAFDRELERASGTLALELSDPYDAARLAELASRAHLAAFPSRLAESYLLVADEAIALGLPVWTTARSAFERFPGGRVRHMPSADPDAWARAFRRVLAAPDDLAIDRAAPPARMRSAREIAVLLEELYAELLAVPARA
jgi:glycosyltransferase involved in cell wall biosynthesis